MKRMYPALILFAGLGSSFSIAQDTRQSDPFQRYFTGLSANEPEASLVRFAKECGISVSSVAPLYAQSPNQKWVPVKDLSNALRDQETDFYATAAVWHVDDKIMVEQWGMELDTGNYFRRFYCLEHQTTNFFEEVDWVIPPLKNDGDRTSDAAWGFEQHRRAGKNGEMEIVTHRFVDAYERPIAVPRLNAGDADLVKDLQSTRKALTWKDLGLPSTLLR